MTAKASPHPWRSEMAAMLLLAAPLALANLLQMAVYAVDVIFVARLGQIPLAAASLSTTLFGLMMWCFSALSGAVSPLIAAELGREIADKAGLSVATVDRVINARRSVRQVTALRVQSATVALGYQPAVSVGSVQEPLRGAVLLQRKGSSTYQHLAEALRQAGPSARAGSGTAGHPGR